MTSIHDALGRLWDANDGDRMLERDGSWASWGSVRSLTERIDRELTAAGCRAGGRVAVVLSNRMESVAALIAIFRGGRTLVTISPLQPPDRLSDDLAASGVSFVLAPAALWSEEVFNRAAADLGATGWRLDDGELDLQVRGTKEAVGGDPAVAIEMLTSGTTGAPKRIPLTRAQLEASLAAALRHNDRPDVRTKPPLTGSGRPGDVADCAHRWAVGVVAVAGRGPSHRDAGSIHAAGLAHGGEAVPARGGRTAPGGDAIGA